MTQKTIVTYKGFNKDLQCRDYQFAIGETYHHEGRLRPAVLDSMRVSVHLMCLDITLRQIADLQKPFHSA
jgi:hypothetical protein